MTDDRPELEDKLSELEILRQSLEESKAKEKDVYEQLLRASAEFQNYRKRSEGRITDARQQGREDVLLEILTLADALSQAAVSTKTATDAEPLKRGLAMVHQQFEKFLKHQGLHAIPAAGNKLDPHRHEAIAQVVNPDLEEGTIVDEVQRGYTLHDRVVRPSRVTVSVKPSESSASPEN